MQSIIFRAGAAAAFCMGLAGANQVDVLFPHYSVPTECGPAGCRPWTAADAKLFLFPADAVSRSVCAIPGKAVNNATGPPETASSGPFCFCKGTGVAAYCMPRLGIPEQINLQYASQDTLVVGFVTYEKAPPAGAEPPTAMFGKEAGTPTALTGISHWLEFAPPSESGPPTTEPRRNYTMSFVKFTNLEPSTHYTYKVKSGAPGAVWSESFTFRSARPAPDTAIGMCEYVSPYISPPVQARYVRKAMRAACPHSRHSNLALILHACCRWRHGDHAVQRGLEPARGLHVRPHRRLCSHGRPLLQPRAGGRSAR
jgi:hypothetical protein